MSAGSINSFHNNNIGGGVQKSTFASSTTLNQTIGTASRQSLDINLISRGLQAIEQFDPLPMRCNISSVENQPTTVIPNLSQPVISGVGRQIGDAMGTSVQSSERNIISEYDHGLPANNAASKNQFDNAMKATTTHITKTLKTFPKDLNEQNKVLNDVHKSIIHLNTAANKYLNTEERDNFRKTLSKSPEYKKIINAEEKYESSRKDLKSAINKFIKADYNKKNFPEKMNSELNAFKSYLETKKDFLNSMISSLGYSVVKSKIMEIESDLKHIDKIPTVTKQTVSVVENNDPIEEMNVDWGVERIITSKLEEDLLQGYAELGDMLANFQGGDESAYQTKYEAFRQTVFAYADRLKTLDAPNKEGIDKAYDMLYSTALENNFKVLYPSSDSKPSEPNAPDPIENDSVILAAADGGYGKGFESDGENEEVFHYGNLADGVYGNAFENDDESNGNISQVFKLDDSSEELPPLPELPVSEKNVPSKSGYIPVPELSKSQKQARSKKGISDSG